MKYPRTTHIQGSLGKFEPKQAALSSFSGKIVVIEEKLDGTQLSIRFENRGKMVFQSRGTILSGGPQEAEFNLMKPWAHAHSNALWERLGTRYIMYGEWLYAKHTVFYDALPHYFLEFDVWDQEKKYWLSTPKRHLLLKDSPITSVPVLYQGPLQRMKSVEEYLAPSLYKSEKWEEQLKKIAKDNQLNVNQVKQQTAMTNNAEGLYLKSESEDETVERYKWIRPDFLGALLDSGSHWKDRSILPNQLCSEANLFASQENHSD